MIRSVCLGIALVGISPLLWAEVNTLKTRELANIQAKIREVGADVKSLVSEKNAQIEQLKKLEKQYGEQINVLNEIKAEIKQKEQELQEIRSKVGLMQQNLQTHRQGLRGLIKSAYAIGDKEGLKVILNQRDQASVGRIKVYYDYISKARVQKLLSIQEDVKTLQQLESQNDTDAQLLQVDLEKKQQEAQALQSLKTQREKLLAEIDNDYALKHGELAKLVHDEQKLEALVASLQKTDDNEGQGLAPQQEIMKPSPSSSPTGEQPLSQTFDKKIEVTEKPSRSAKVFADMQGQLPWPVQGVISDHFGARRFETTWDGAVISAREGADIRAVAEGRVVYADWLRGYGLMIIVDHGKGYMSLYAFNQSLHKSVGEHVKAGETLASVGRSGGRSQAALYFGIRNKGRPVDPEKWCRRLEKS